MLKSLESKHRYKYKKEQKLNIWSFPIKWIDQVLILPFLCKLNFRLTEQLMRENSCL